MEPSALIPLILAGGLLGLIGQGIRSVVGLKKVYDEKPQTASTRSFMKDNFSTARFMLTLFIGFLAGTLGVLTLDSVVDGALDRSTILTLIGLGYSGTDAIEGIVTKYVT